MGEPGPRPAAGRGPGNFQFDSVINLLGNG